MAAEATASLPTQAPEPTLVEYKQAIKIESPLDQPKLSEMEALLSGMLPTRMWVTNGQVKVQYVSSTPATTATVIATGEKLDGELEKQGAHRVGVCDLRSHLHEQCFDEIIRQVTLTCKVRGKLLKRVHNEIRERIEMYQALYESSNAYGVRSSLQGSSKKDQLRQRIAELERSNRELEKKIETEMLKREKFAAAEEKKSRESKQMHESNVKKSMEDYDDLMKVYREKVSVSFDDKKKKKKKGSART
eukprot:CAMPEP_0197534614 /NCGR_PEP_ID=MMETSP1318-20131121/47745_1 /TAXON_ID=552666 /ORGANISM="Partenskyella glossopodia, Strain RCC365" /LENGTH=246 /DNA_ID=CAMNT_0043091945 /DNA_START=21 /DNA_END=761 /DNA_ORIENTATION=+